MVRRVLYYFFLIISTFVFSLSIKADETSSFTVSAANWDGYTDKNGKGIYYELIKAIYDESKISFLTSTYPRALNQFKLKKSDIMVGVYKHELPLAHYGKWFLDTDMPVYVFYKANNNNSKITKDSLKGKQIAWYKGYGFDKFFPNAVSSYEIDNIETGFRLLINERIDYFLDYKHNFNSKYKDTIQYQPIRGVDRLYLAFQDNQKGKMLASIFDKKMLRLKKSGKLKQLFGNDYARSGHSDLKN